MANRIKDMVRPIWFLGTNLATETIKAGRYDSPNKAVINTKIQNCQNVSAHWMVTNIIPDNTKLPAMTFSAPILSETFPPKYEPEKDPRPKAPPIQPASCKLNPRTVLRYTERKGNTMVPILLIKVKAARTQTSCG